MKRIVVEPPGGPEQMKVVEAPKPVAGPKDAVVKVAFWALKPPLAITASLSILRPSKSHAGCKPFSARTARRADPKS